MYLRSCYKCNLHFDDSIRCCPKCGGLLEYDSVELDYQCANCLCFVPDDVDRCPNCGTPFPKEEGMKAKSKSSSQGSTWSYYENDIVLLAKRATPELQTKLGLMYEECDFDYITSYKLFCLAAVKDYAPAMVQIGDCYNEWFNDDDKEEYRIDYNKAFQWYSKAAELGDAEGQFKVGKCYYKGSGVTEDKRKAVYWFKKSAQQNFAEASEILGECYRYAYGVDKNIKEAIKWYEIAAKEHRVKAVMELGLLYYYGDEIPKDYKKAFGFLTKIEKSNLKWLALRKNRSLTRKVLEVLGDCYYFGYGTNIDYLKAIKMFERAVEFDSNYALYSLGFCYEHGQGVEKNSDSLKMAFDYYNKAAENGHAESVFKVGKFYKEGLCVKVDKKKAMEYFLKAAKLGNEKAEEELKKVLMELG